MGVFLRFILYELGVVVAINANLGLLSCKILHQGTSKNGLSMGQIVQPDLNCLNLILSKFSIDL